MEERSVRRCDQDRCATVHYARGMCRKHYARAWAAAELPTLPQPTVRERFWAFVDDSDQRACWEWGGTRNADGYGTFYPTWREPVGAHVFAWEDANARRRPPGKVVRHRCDNRPCVNPTHLELGTRADNSRDMWERSERPAAAKLTKAQVREIRERLALNHSARMIAEDFAVSPWSIRAIARGRTWKDVT